jgi:hypothetical protein
MSRTVNFPDGNPCNRGPPEGGLFLLLSGDLSHGLLENDVDDFPSELNRRGFPRLPRFFRIPEATE